MNSLVVIGSWLILSCFQCPEQNATRLPVFNLTWWPCERLNGFIYKATVSERTEKRHIFHYMFNIVSEQAWLVSEQAWLMIDVRADKV